MAFYGVYTKRFGMFVGINLSYFDACDGKSHLQLHLSQNLQLHLKPWRCKIFSFNINNLNSMACNLLSLTIFPLFWTINTCIRRHLLWMNKLGRLHTSSRLCWTCLRVRIYWSWCVGLWSLCRPHGIVFQGYWYDHWGDYGGLFVWQLWCAGQACGQPVSTQRLHLPRIWDPSHQYLSGT